MTVPELDVETSSVLGDGGLGVFPASWVRVFRIERVADRARDREVIADILSREGQIEQEVGAGVGVPDGQAP